MAVDILLDSTGDIDLVGNKIKLTTNVQQLARQQVLISLTTYKGEWKFNINFGVPYLANDDNPIHLLGAGNNKNLVDLYITEAILANESVSKILEYESNFDKYNDKMEVSFTFLDSNSEVVEINSVLDV